MCIIGVFTIVHKLPDAPNLVWLCLWLQFCSVIDRKKLEEEVRFVAVERWQRKWWRRSRQGKSRETKILMWIWSRGGISNRRGTGFQPLLLPHCTEGGGTSTQRGIIWTYIIIPKVDWDCWSSGCVSITSVMLTEIHLHCWLCLQLMIVYVPACMLVQTELSWSLLLQFDQHT